MMSAVCFGEILWDILADERMPGGAPMNVCYHLNKLKQSAFLISKIGDDDNGKDLMRFLERQRIDTTRIQIDQQYSTGTVIASQQGNEMLYDIVQPVAWDFIESPKSLNTLVAKADYFICGSLVARNKHSRDTLFSLLDIAQTSVVDINLRPPYFNEEVVKHLLTKADILKLNNHEIDLIGTWYCKGADLKDYAQRLSEQFNISMIIITQGENGATVFAKGALHTHPGYFVKVADTIGSGDAFLAGFLSKYQYDGVDKALDFACKLGAFVASQKGGCPPYSIADIENQIL